MNKEVTERRGRNHRGEGLPPLRFPGGHASHLHIINSVGNFSLLRNHIPKGKREWPVIYLFMVNKEQYSLLLALVWLQVPEPLGARHTVSLFAVISGSCEPRFLYFFFFKLFEFFCKQLNSPGGKRERSWEGGEDIY